MLYVIKCLLGIVAVVALTLIVVFLAAIIRFIRKELLGEDEDHVE